MRRLFSLFFLALTGCVAIPEGLSAVKPFDVSRYTGEWYEIVRLDHSFERGLSKVSATYTTNPDGTIKVINRGYNAAKGKWQEAEGVAKFVGERDIGALKVSFFGPFYGSYNIIELDPDYQYSLVTGPDRNYLWLLARTPTLPFETRERLIARAKELGFAVEKLQKGQ